MKNILITAGTVYGPLDANKLVGNRVRGIWAVAFARYLTKHGHKVTLLVPDTMDKAVWGPHLNLQLRVLTHKGFWDYQEKCIALAPQHDAAVMAAAVVNWIPAQPYEGKMPTKGFNEGDVINIPFILAPHVIDQMKKANPKLTLIGCKMLVNAPHEELIEAAYGVLLKARCNAVIANDMGKGLRTKWVVNQDRSVQEYDNDFEGFYANLLGHIEDEHYSTDLIPIDRVGDTDFDEVVKRHGPGFIPRQQGSEMVFGSIFVPNKDRDGKGFWGRMLGTVSTREKAGHDIQPVFLLSIKGKVVHIGGNQKATLNAPLLVRVAEKYPEARAILHQHRQLEGYPTVPYAPPGTVRDNEREIPGPVFNIEGHGFIACLDKRFNIFEVTG